MSLSILILHGRETAALASALPETFRSYFEEFASYATIDCVMPAHGTALEPRSNDVVIYLASPDLLENRSAYDLSWKAEAAWCYPCAFSMVVVAEDCTWQESPYGGLQHASLGKVEPNNLPIHLPDHLVDSLENTLTQALDSRVHESLERWRSGDPSAFDDLTGLMYVQLKSIARARRRRLKSETYLTTDVVHECLDRIRTKDPLGFKSPDDFRGFYSVVVKNFLIDQFRRRGSRIPRVDFDIEGQASLPQQADSVQWFAKGLAHLTTLDPKLAHIAELKWVEGWRIQEIANELNLSVRHIDRLLRRARVILKDFIDE